MRSPWVVRCFEQRAPARSCFNMFHYMFQGRPFQQEQVNGDDPLAVTSAFELAAEWRQTWQTDATCINPYQSIEASSLFGAGRRMRGWPENRVNRVVNAVKVLQFRTAWTCSHESRGGWQRLRNLEVSKVGPRLDQGWIKVGAEVRGNILEHVGTSHRNKTFW